MKPHPLLFCLLVMATAAHAADVDPLAVGVAGHAFDHLGAIADQAPAAAASGANIIYGTGFGSIGYQGLSSPKELAEAGKTASAYVHDAKAGGIRLAIGYVCATSIVKLETFDRNWSKDFRAQFSAAPANWLQQDRDGKPLPSWYGGDYRPACMNNPDWRAYEKFIVRQQLECGYDGIFFDNPTVHPQGCYCEHCMTKFAQSVSGESVKLDLAALRKLAVSRPKEFMRFRCTIAAEFLAEMRAYARTIKPAALMTCNNSLNSPGAFFSQCRTYGYNIHEMSRAEDLVIVEDMESQPRVRADGSVIEYGPVYEMLHAISHGKPLVAVTLADADYHTPPNLTRLVMAEAAAHGASYLSWPTWPETERPKMIGVIRPQADFLKTHAELLNDTKSRADVCLFLPFRRWIGPTDCKALQAARALSRTNVQFKVVSEEDLAKRLSTDAPPALVVESASILNDPERGLIEKYKAAGGQVIWSEGKNWLGELQAIQKKTAAIVVDGPPSLRAVVREQEKKTIVHLLNLNVLRLSSFEDRVTPAPQLRLKVRCHADRPTAIKALSADPDATQGDVEFATTREAGAFVVELTLPRVILSTILVIE
jgi:hypothetical protein